jgi:GNAT superfamily N-acetyltransferase
MASITVRAARPGDERALVRIHAEVARYYRDLAPDYFAALERAAEQFAAEPGASDTTTLHLVAEADDEVVGTLVAKLLPADDDASTGPGAGADVSRLRIEYLATEAASRRQGVGTRLVEAAEAWGREAGATVAETTAYHGSALSEPFWGERMNYEERSINLRKSL